MDYDTDYAESPTMVSWKPAWSRKPQSGDAVLVCYRLPYGSPTVSIGLFCEHDQAWRLTSGPVVDVTHWAPLPPAPRSL